MISAAVSAASLLLAWYRGGTTRRPRMARTLGALTLVSALGLIVALAFASAADDEIEAARPASLSADEYRLRFIGVCKEHLREAESIERAERGRPMFGVTVQLERRTTDKLQELRPPRALQADHRKAVTLWLRRVSLLDHFYGRYRREKDDPAFQRQSARP